MPEWLDSLGVSAEIPWTAMALRLTVAAFFGFLVAGVYAGTQRRENGSLISMVTTLVLLTILVAMTTIVIGDSVARAFGLVGALSIVRFRTVVDDTRDTSFVIFAVVVGMAIGAGHFVVCAAGVPVVALVSFALSGFGGAIGSNLVPRKLEVRLGTGHDPETLLSTVFRDRLAYWKLTSIVSARQGAAFDLIYQVQLRDPKDMLTLVKTIHAIDGVQNVELKDV